eukprot:523626_1
MGTDIDHYYLSIHIIFILDPSIQTYTDLLFLSYHIMHYVHIHIIYLLFLSKSSSSCTTHLYPQFISHSLCISLSDRSHRVNHETFEATIRFHHHRVTMHSPSP